MPNHFTYTPPREIEGEPNEVVELSLQQLSELAATVGTVTLETYVQVRAAGVTELSLDEWLATPQGKQCEDLAWAAKVFVEASKALIG